MRKKIIAGTLLASSLFFSGFIHSYKTVDLTYNGKQEEIKTRAKTVSDFLKEENIKVKKDDLVNKKLNSELKKKDKIKIDEVIQREVEVPIKENKTYSIDLPYGKKEIKQEGEVGKQIEYRTKYKNRLVKTKKIVEMKEKNILIGSRIEKVEPVKYETTTVENDKKRENTKKVKQKGMDGERQKIFERIDGKKDKLISDKMTKEPIKEVIEKGTKPEYKTEELTDLNKDGNIDGLDFIEFHRDEIIAIGRQTGIYPSIIAAQLIHESGRSMNGLAKNANNYFGIKYAPKLGRLYGATPYDSDTFEFVDGERVNTRASFAKFKDFKTCLNAFLDLYWNGLYDSTVKKEIYNLEKADVNSMLKAINESPYSTSDKYSDALIDCINVFGSSYLDEIAFPDGRKQAGTFDNKEVYKIGEYPDDGYNFEDITWKSISWLFSFL